MTLFASSKVPAGQRLTCQHCKEKKYQNHYSLYRTVNGNDTNESVKDQHHQTCNECLVKNKARWAKLLYMGASADWMEFAACKDAEDPEIFFPIEPHSLKKRAWDKYCAGCPVTAECDKQRELTNACGVWGGEYWDSGMMRSESRHLRYAQMRTAGSMYRKGYSKAAIARQLGVSHHKVTNMLVDLKLVAPKVRG